MIIISEKSQQCGIIWVKGIMNDKKKNRKVEHFGRNAVSYQRFLGDVLKYIRIILTYIIVCILISALKVLT